MDINNSIPVERLKLLLRYDSETGYLFWKYRTVDMFLNLVSERYCNHWNTRYANSRALACLDRHGYFCGRLDNKRVSAHRVAFAIYYDGYPSEQIDHINHDRTDNRIENLREVSNSQNGKNTSLHKNNTTGCSGLTFAKHVNMWRARIKYNGDVVEIGYFENKDDAIKAIEQKRILLGFHINHGK